MALSKSTLFTIVCGIALAGGVLWYVLFGENASPGAPFSIAMAELRRVATAPISELPTQIAVERVAQGGLPAAFVVARGGVGQYQAVYASYRVSFANGRSLMVDTAYDHDGWKRIDGTLSEFNAASWNRVHAAMVKADAIVVTHEHGDHIAGLAGSPDAWSHARLTPLQAQHAMDFTNNGVSAQTLAAMQTLPDAQVQALAPGVVLLKAPGHSPGSQMVYVRRSDGREYLFVGDIAWNADNISTLRARPRISSWFLHEDRDAVMAQLLALNALQKAAPQLAVVVAHDKQQLDEHVANGLIEEGFR